MFPAHSSFELSPRHTHTRPRGEGQGECEWFSKNRRGLNHKELEDVLVTLPVNTDSHNARKSENESQSKCSRIREVRGESCVAKGSIEKQQDKVTTGDKQRGTLLQSLEHCDSNRSFTTSSPMLKRKISDYFAAVPRPN